MAEEPAAWTRSVLSVREADEFCARFERLWMDGQRPRIEDYLAGLTSSGLFESEREAVLGRLLAFEVQYRLRAGEMPSREEYYQRFPDCQRLVEQVFAAEGTSGTT